MKHQISFLALPLLGLMLDYGDEPCNPSAILALSLAVITLRLNGALMLPVAAECSHQYQELQRECYRCR